MVQGHPIRFQALQCHLCLGLPSPSLTITLYRFCHTKQEAGVLLPPLCPTAQPQMGASLQSVHAQGKLQM